MSATRTKTSRRSGYALVALALSIVPPQAAAQPVPVGVEFVANSNIVAAQGHSAVALDADGDFVIVWQDSDGDGGYSGIFGRRFDSAGTPLAVEFQVNSHTLLSQQEPAVAVGAAGGFVVVWQSEQQDGSESGIFGRVFDAAGVRQGVEFRVNAHTSLNQSYPDVALLGSGAFVVVWRSLAQDGAEYGIFARRVDASGVPQGNEIQINAHTLSDQKSAAIAADGTGDFIVVWHSSQQDGFGQGVFGRRFDSVGSPQGGDFQVSSYTAGDESYPDVAADIDGDFVIAWQAGNLPDVFVRRFDSTGVAQSDELRVNSYTPVDQRLPRVAMDTDGDFVVAWESQQQDGDSEGAFVKAFKRTGFPATHELMANQYTQFNQNDVAVAMDPDGDFVVTWTSYGRDGDDEGVSGRRFVSPIRLDVDGDGIFDALTDGLLVIRYAFGFRGDTLVDDVVSEACTRCTANQIETYLGSLAR